MDRRRASRRAPAPALDATGLEDARETQRRPDSRTASAIAYGRIRIVDDRAAKPRFFDALMAKYGTGAERPKSFYRGWTR